MYQNQRNPDFQIFQEVPLDPITASCIVHLAYICICMYKHQSMVYRVGLGFSLDHFPFQYGVHYYVSGGTSILSWAAILTADGAVPRTPSLLTMDRCY